MLIMQVHVEAKYKVYYKIEYATLNDQIVVLVSTIKKTKLWITKNEVNN